jgi:hypothetical protein
MTPPNTRGADYYHCFMGNGLDAVLVGYTGAMVAERAQGNLDRCCWYKSDRYYPEDRAVVIPERLPREGQPLRAEGAPWSEIAPLAHTWYEVRRDGLRLDCRLSEQRFAPSEGTLYSRVDYGAATAEVVTFLHARRSLLVMHFLFDRPVNFRAYAAAGVWVEEGYDADPFDEVIYSADGAGAEYTLGGVRGRIMLALSPEPAEANGGDVAARNCCLEVEAREVTQYFAVVDDLDGPLERAALDDARALSYEALREEHLAAWRSYSARSKIEIPNATFQRSYDYSLYQFKAAQNRLSGGLPVNNLRLTWSSHVFWDAYFMHRALLEANRRAEALEGVQFFMRTLDHARRHASEEFGAPGLKWDWEITHRGERAYGTWLHQKEQVHNNASYANMIWGYYEFTRDRDYLAAFYPLLRGIAEFFLANVIERTARGYEVRALVDVGERVTPVRNEGYNLTAAIRILQLAAKASRVLETNEEFAARCSETAVGLIGTLDLLYNGQYFRSAEDVDTLSPSSLAPIYPMMIIAPADPRAVSTARSYLEREHKDILSPWFAGILSTIFALQHDGDTAWQVITRIAGAICEFGGMSEHVYPSGRWNMQYFGTAQGAVCTAIHHLMLQGREGEISLFPAVPSGWPGCSYERLLVNGVEVSGRFDRDAGRAWAELLNTTGNRLVSRVNYGRRTDEVPLPPGQSQLIEWEI